MSRMKSWVPLLVLLCCSPCKMEIQSEDHDLEVHHEDGENTWNDTKTEQRIEATVVDTATSRQQSYDTDIITALLIQMSAALGELRAELRNTKTEMSTLEARLRDSEKLIEQQQKENEVLHLAQTVELKDLKVRSDITDTKVDDLRRNQEDSKVSFSASLLGSGGDTNVGPVNTRITLIYKHVFTNVGNAYNPNTGIFTAPVRGVYQFTMYIYARASSANPVSTSLMKNGQQVLAVHGHQTGPHFLNASNGASLVLEAGDVVYVQLWENRIIVDNGNCHSTFSGHLLFTQSTDSS